MHPGTTLTDAIRKWPTPDAQAFNEGQTLEARERRRAVELEKGYNGNGGGEPLAFVATQRWATPRSSDWKGHETAPGKTGSFMLGRQAHQTVTDGLPPLLSTPRLNPRFVQWLMGLPIGWSSFEPLGTRWSLWQQRMRSELSRLGWEVI